MKHGEALEHWVTADLERSREENRRAKLKKLLAEIHQHPDSRSLPAGSSQRLLVESHERKVMQSAMDLGYEPPEQVLKELGLHLGVELGLGL
ncbi:hypothetical protein MQE22_08795 [Acidithiobacillus sp. YTS05]|nr:hypothetical protein MQE22_08795 [Acidithiobacillus sp. YTS05]